MYLNFVLMFLWILVSCSEHPTQRPDADSGSVTTRTIRHEGRSVQVILDKPQGTSFDVLMVFHGTVQGTSNQDQLILEAAETTRRMFRAILDRPDILIVSVAYPQADLLFGDNLVYAEAALLWLRNVAEAELGVELNRVFLAGHSQGGYIVTRLNTLYQTDGVIANAPGPLNLLYRCQLEESGQVQATAVCALLRANYGTTSQNPEEYLRRSLRNHVGGQKAEILFVQGLDDSPIQMHSWPLFRDDLQRCGDCAPIRFLELQGLGHNALFNSQQARTEFNVFLNR
jgi:poly(3-hydroxybutyrate) depolymerase